MGLKNFAQEAVAPLVLAVALGSGCTGEKQPAHSPEAPQAPKTSLTSDSPQNLHTIDVLEVVVNACRKCGEDALRAAYAGHGYVSDVVDKLAYREAEVSEKKCWAVASDCFKKGDAERVEHLTDVDVDNIVEDVADSVMIKTVIDCMNENGYPVKNPPINVSTNVSSHRTTQID